MLKALYDYGVREQLALPAGYVKKTIAAYISFSGNEFVGIYKGDEREFPCPDIGSLANGKTKSNVLVEKRSVVLPDEANAKSAFFLEALLSAAEYEPSLKPCVSALESPELSEIIRKELDRQKIKAGDRVSFRVDGEAIVEFERILAWWQEFRKQFQNLADVPSSRCLITGELTVPVVTTPPIQGLYAVGGHGRGDALICFDKDAFCSYDLKQAANAPVSEEAYSVVKAALDNLLKDAPVLAGMKFVHWYDRKVTAEDDPILTEDFGFGVPDDNEDHALPVNECAERRNADSVPQSVRSGQQTLNLDGTTYHILLLSGVNGRIMVRKYDRGNYAELRRNLALWYSDLALTNPYGTAPVKSCKLTARLLRLLNYQKADRKPFERLNKELSGITPMIINAVLMGGQLPDSVAARSLAYIRSVLLSDDENKLNHISYACQWLKVWLIRKAKYEQQEVSVMEDYNLLLSNPAYHCGGMMAIYAAIQEAAMPDVNTGIVERYYSSAIQSPALVIGQLSSRSVYHLEMIEKKSLANRYREKLQEISSALGAAVPATLNLEQQSYFALGYYQMGAMLKREWKEKTAEKKQRDNMKEEH